MQVIQWWTTGIEKEEEITLPQTDINKISGSNQQMSVEREVISSESNRLSQGYIRAHLFYYPLLFAKTEYIVRTPPQ